MSRKTWRAWTKEDKQEVQALLKQGLSTAEIGERVGRSAVAIQSYCNNHGLSRGKVRWYTEEELTQIEELRLEGKTVKEIAAAVNRPWQALLALCSRQGFIKIPRRKQLWLGYFEAGLSNKEVARRMGKTHKCAIAMRSQLRRAGLLEDDK